MKTLDDYPWPRVVVAILKITMKKIGISKEDVLSELKWASEKWPNDCGTAPTYGEYVAGAGDDREDP